MLYEIYDRFGVMRARFSQGVLAHRILIALQAEEPGEEFWMKVTRAS